MPPPPEDTPSTDSPATTNEQPQGILQSEDWWAVWIGGGVAVVLLGTIFLLTLGKPADFARHRERIATSSIDLETQQRELRVLETQAEANPDDERLRERLATARQEARVADKKLDALRLEINPTRSWFSKPGGWDEDPLMALGKHGTEKLPGILGVFVVTLLLFGLGARVMGTSFRRFAPAFCCVFLLATLTYVLAGQSVIKHYNLEYALWALLIGLLISNTVGTPEFLRPAARTEFYIKTGLVLLGAEILLGRLVSLGLPGIFVSWVVTPIVLVSTYYVGQRLLRIPSKSLNMVISADMSVCGVSAAIATAAACRAKKEELSLAIGISLTFTVIMMVVMPAIISVTGMSNVLGGAWMGGTIDSTGAVAAAGGILGDTALQVAATVKMIQNILIGIVAFVVAVYWVTKVEPRADGAKPSVFEIWHRFPKFVIGFVAASVVFSLVHQFVAGGSEMVEATIGGTTKALRGWCFCLAFVSIGLETNFRALAAQLQGGKPLLLYVIGQTFNLCLTLFMAWLMFEVVFRDATASLSR